MYYGSSPTRSKLLLVCGGRAAIYHGVLAGVVGRGGGALAVTARLHRVLFLWVVKDRAGWLHGAHHAVSPPLILLEFAPSDISETDASTLFTWIYHSSGWKGFGKACCWISTNNMVTHILFNITGSFTICIFIHMTKNRPALFVSAWQTSCTYRFGVGMIAGGVTDHSVANQTVPWKQESVAHRRQQHFFGLRKKPFDGYVTEHRRHGFLQRLYHL